MTLDDSIRQRVVFFGGKVSGVDCPNCEYTGRESDLDAHRFTSVTCPNCGTTILTDAQKSALRQAGKL